MALDTLPWKDIVTIGAAALGAVLGIMNTWNAVNQRRVRLRVRPAHATMVPSGRSMFSIEVVNLSAFPLTISEVGFTLKRGGIKQPRAAVITPILIDNKPWPRKLEPRESVSVYFDPSTMRSGPGRRPLRAYARSACGEVEYGNSPALRQLAKQANDA